MQFYKLKQRIASNCGRYRQDQSKDVLLYNLCPKPISSNAHFFYLCGFLKKILLVFKIKR